MIASNILLDSAREGFEIDSAKMLNAQHLSLYIGKGEEELAEVAPYIFTLPAKHHFTNWFCLEGWGEAWGLMILSNANLEELRKHFRRFLTVKSYDGMELYFRFYDPRVLRIFLPTCDAGQLKEFFGPVEQFICEDEDANFALVFSLIGSQLQTKRVLAAEVFSDLGIQPSQQGVPSVTTEVQTIVESSKPTTLTEEPPTPKRRFFVD